MDRAKRKKHLKNWKNVNREMARESAQWPDDMVEIPPEKWPAFDAGYMGKLKPIKCFRSKRFFAQVVQEQGGAIRISVNRTRFNENLDYVDGITWDELFTIKNQIGYAANDCIEIYPAARDLVNVANIRHLFVLPEQHEFTWKGKR